MKAHIDLFKKPLTKDEVRTAATITVRTGYADAIILSSQMKVGYTKATKLAQLMYDAGILVDSTMRGTTIVLKNEDTAINVALRQLRKGNG